MDGFVRSTELFVSYGIILSSQDFYEMPVRRKKARALFRGNLGTDETFTGFANWNLGVRPVWKM
jgi:hypothetical protein